MTPDEKHDVEDTAAKNHLEASKEWKAVSPYPSMLGAGEAPGGMIVMSLPLLPLPTADERGAPADARTDLQGARHRGGRERDGAAGGAVRVPGQEAQEGQEEEGAGRERRQAEPGRGGVGWSGQDTDTAELFSR
jgi:hypothetical protein